ncbi:MAG: ABC transporter ATP-binding protein/permease [Defluviitaleaceae bacterium]|nr:ABC transporter ATP-binding protein/permease [Defluviitaleaceae bacterium]
MLNTFKRMYKLTKGNRHLYGIAIVCTFIAVLIALVPPLVISFTLDNAILGYEPLTFVHRFFYNFIGAEFVRNNLWVPFILIVFLSILRSLAGYTNNRLQAATSENIIKDMRNKIYNHLQKLPYSYHVKAQTGELIQRATSDVENIRAFMAGQINEMIRTFLLAVIALIILFNLHVTLALVSTIVLPVMFIASYIFNKKMKAAFLKQDEKEGELFETIQENLTGVRVVRAFGRSSYEIEKFSKKNDEFRDLVANLFKVRAIYWMASDFAGFSQIAAILTLGSIFALNGELTIGTLIIFMLYGNNLVWPIRNMGRILADMGRMGVSFDRIDEILNEPIEEDEPNAKTPSLNENIVFENVTFAYEDEKKVLQNLNFEIKKGETIAILGATGSGKSTIMHLLLRLYDINIGNIKIGNVPIKEISKKHLREKIGLVLQEPFLYSRTINENLKMAKTEVLEAEILKAAKIAKVHEVIESFENKYETMLGERGVTLSGGQRQRVAIARTIIKNSEILIFDDSLSAVDTETDSQIRAELKERAAYITTIIISQRITTLKEADKIFVMEKGRIADIGTHEELIHKDGLYKKIWNIQSMLEEEMEDEKLVPFEKVGKETDGRDIKNASFNEMLDPSTEFDNETAGRDTKK